MNPIKIFTSILLAALMTSSCGNPTNQNLGNKLNLMKYGIPYVIQAPSDVEINKLGSGRLVDLAIKNESGFDIQVFMSAAYSNDIEQLKTLKKNEATSHPSFVKIIEEFDEGFIFEKTSDEGNRSYDFSIIKIIGNNEINFQSGNSKEFSESDVKMMVKNILG